ncbi:MAG: 3-methyladenine DNA glycosylase [Gemmatimonadaceae bacterium]
MIVYDMPDSSLPPTLNTAELLLTTAEWQARALSHLERVQRWTLPFRDRRSRREVHPVYDFLFTYYGYSGGRLEKWHPGSHELIVDSTEARERFNSPAYHAANGVIRRNANALSDAERKLLEQALHVLSTTRDRAANFGCYGMHEWAMVYGGHDVRHAEIAPLRLPQHEIDAFVESRPVACSHFDAFRFFAPAAQPMNRVALSWSTRDDVEQPGCIHANMDLYRWAYSSMPWIGTDLLWDCFELAVKLRVLDMQAGPYDLSAMGFEPVRVETAEGRDEYQRRQREMSARASVLRSRLVDAVGGVLQNTRQ